MCLGWEILFKLELIKFFVARAIKSIINFILGQVSKNLKIPRCTLISRVDLKGRKGGNPVQIYLCKWVNCRKGSLIMIYWVGINLCLFSRRLFTFKCRRKRGKEVKCRGGGQIIVLKYLTQIKIFVPCHVKYVKCATCVT